MFRIIAFFIITLFAGLFVRVGIFPTRGKRFHYYICVLGVSILPLSTILIFDFGISYDCVVFFIFHFIIVKCIHRYNKCFVLCVFFSFLIVLTYI